MEIGLGKRLTGGTSKVVYLDWESATTWTNLGQQDSKTDGQDKFYETNVLDKNCQRAYL